MHGPQVLNQKSSSTSRPLRSRRNSHGRPSMSLSAKLSIRRADSIRHEGTGSGSDVAGRADAADSGLERGGVGGITSGGAERDGGGTLILRSGRGLRYGDGGSSGRSPDVCPASGGISGA